MGGRRTTKDELTQLEALTKEGLYIYTRQDSKSEFLLEIGEHTNEIGINELHPLNVITIPKDIPASKEEVRNVSRNEKKDFDCKANESKDRTDLLQNPKTYNKTISKREQNQNKAYSVVEIRQKYARAYEKWTKEEDENLAKNYREGMTVTQLAKIHQRKRGAIHSRLRKKGLVE